MNQRQVNDIQFIPEITKESKSARDEKSPEDLIFDKAIKADKIDDKIESLEKIDEELKQLKLKLKDAKDTEVINKQIKTLEEKQEKINANIDDEKKKLDEEK
jgi:DNA repair exonuclease SbcCD ATPase subunit